MLHCSNDLSCCCIECSLDLLQSSASVDGRALVAQASSGPSIESHGQVQSTAATGMILDPVRDLANLPMPPIDPQKLRVILDVAVVALERDEAIALIRDSIAAKSHLKLGFCNANVANVAVENTAYRDALAAFIMLSDGIGVDLAARVLYGAPFPANLNGTDFVPALLGAVQDGTSIRLIGAKPGVGEKAAKVLLQRFPMLDIACLGDGYFDADGEAKMLEDLIANPADILLVAMGNPRQELWIASKIARQHTHVAIGVGALFDFLGGEVSRAPSWVRTLRCEWLYRLAQEPARLWRRYLVGNPLFLMRVLAAKLKRASR
jgi:exopolysaccharide biosynthesis WecB/TagA/CpsF family protein